MEDDVKYIYYYAVVKKCLQQIKIFNVGGGKKREKQGFVLNFPDKDNEI